MSSILTGVEGLRRIATEYLDAMHELKNKPEARLVGDALRAGRNFELGSKIVKEEDKMIKELFMRITPNQRSGRALAKEA